jgi:hypothetical protein
MCLALDGRLAINYSFRNIFGSASVQLGEEFDESKTFILSRGLGSSRTRAAYVLEKRIQQLLYSDHEEREPTQRYMTGDSVGNALATLPLLLVPSQSDPR